MDEVAAIETKTHTETATSSIDSPFLRFHGPRNDMYAAGSRVRGMEGIFLPCHYFDYIGGTGVGG